MSPLARTLACATIACSASCAALAAAPYPNTSNFGVPFSEGEHWYQQCMRVAKLPEPTLSAARGGSPKCKAGELYYSKRNQAKTSPAEWNKVRECAIASADNAVLMMLYANGLGLQRDTDMALHYACSLEHVAKAEMEARVEHLAGAQRADLPFDQCDDITSGYMGAVCADIRERQDERIRDARLDRIARALPAPGRGAFEKLRAAAERYASAGSGEVDMHGTGAPEFSLEQQARLREQFMQAALDAFNGKLQSSSPSELMQRDRELNELYRAVITAPSAQNDWPDRIGESTISHAAVRDTQRLWLAYRDAFVAFGARLPSGPDPTAIKTLLTSQRIAQLEKIARYR
jgi:uncharacterized protein YecT (DUF1311 family)